MKRKAWWQPLGATLSIVVVLLLTVWLIYRRFVLYPHLTEAQFAMAHWDLYLVYVVAASSVLVHGMKS